MVFDFPDGGQPHEKIMLTERYLLHSLHFCD